jgi:putative transposase
MPVAYDGRRYVIIHILSLEEVLAKDSESGKVGALKVCDLEPIESLTLSEEREAQEITLIPQDAWAEGERWLKIIKPLLEATRPTLEIVKDVAKKAGVGVSTLYRKQAKYKSYGRTSVLAPGKSSGGKGKSRLTPQANELLVATIKFCVKNRYSKEKTYKEVKNAFQTAKIKPPHQNTIRNRIKALSDEEKDIKKLGEKAAKKKHTAFPGHLKGADFPLALTQIDHAHFDNILVDDIYRLPVGRPWVTLLIDVFSRMLLGYYISPDRPNTASVGLCVANAILSKEKILAKLGIPFSWPCWGFMAKIQADNAGEFRGDMLKTACKEYDIDLEWRPVARPNYGGHIERFFGTILKQVHDLPGTTFSNIKERCEYDSEGNDIMTYSEFEQWFLTYITGVYHQKPHSSLHIPPIKQYERGILGTDDIPGRGFPRKAVDEDRLTLDLMPYYKRTVQGYGYTIDYVHYYSDVLSRYVNSYDPDDPKGKRKRKFIIRRFPKDISVSYFFDPEIKQYFEIPYRDTSLPPMTEWDFRAARTWLEKQGRDNTDERAIAEAYEQMRAIQEASASKTKSARRAQQRRRHYQQIDKPKTASQKQPEAVYSKQPDKSSPPPVILPFEDIDES